jgi:hypothetical protein
MAPEIHTYHCLCSQLLLATTLPLQSCARRGGESLDKAYILPLSSTLAALPEASESAQDQSSSISGNSNYSALLHTILDRKPITIRRSDGFETRYQHRCSRCNLVIGYHLDKSQYDQSQTGRREDVFYVLPEALMTTTDMAESKDNAS